MPARFEHHRTVRDDEIDFLGHVNNIVYLRWMLDAAIAHSTVQGWPNDRYFKMGSGWVVRRVMLQPEQVDAGGQTDQLDGFGAKKLATSPTLAILIPPRIAAQHQRQQENPQDHRFSAVRLIHEFRSFHFKVGHIFHIRRQKYTDRLKLTATTAQVRWRIFILACVLMAQSRSTHRPN